MAQVITLENFVPTARYDSIPWTEMQIEEGATATGVFTLIDTLTLSPVDTDPEHPQARAFTTELASDDPDLWYRVIFVDASGDVSLPTVPIQNVEQREPYATVNELARILKVRTPTDEQTNHMERVLIAASGEIDSEIDRDVDDPIAGWELELAAEVCLKRAVELWAESPFGLIGMENAEFVTHTARNSWERHAHMLAPLKGQFGLA